MFLRPPSPFVLQLPVGKGSTPVTVLSQGETLRMWSVWSSCRTAVSLWDWLSQPGQHLELAPAHKAFYVWIPAGPPYRTAQLPPLQSTPRQLQWQSAVFTALSSPVWGVDNGSPFPITSQATLGLLEAHECLPGLCPCSLPPSKFHPILQPSSLQLLSSHS